MRIVMEPVDVTIVMQVFVRLRNDYARTHRNAEHGTFESDYLCILNSLCSALDEGNLLRAVFWMGQLDVFDNRRGGSTGWYQLLNLEDQAHARLA